MKKQNYEVNKIKQHNIGVPTVIFMIFCLVAAGCYGIEEMVPESGPGLTIIMLVVLPFVWGAPLGLVASELGSARPQEGGYYKWVQEALGEYWGFQAGWWRTISIYIDNTLYVILAGNYISGWLNLTSAQEMIFKMSIIIVFTVINLRGVRDVGIVSGIIAIMVMTMFALVAVCGFLNWEQNPVIPITAAAADGVTTGFSGICGADWIYYIGMGIAVGMWCYSGYESMSTISGEISNPMVIPKATMLAVPLIAASYILPTTAGLATMNMEKIRMVLTPEELADIAAQWGIGVNEIEPWMCWGSDAGAIGYVDVLTTNWGQGFAGIFVIVAILAMVSVYNTYIASGSRGFFALAEDNLAPKFFTKVDKKHGVPYTAIVSVGVVNMILCNFSFSMIIVVDVILLIASYILIYVAAMKLRKTIPEEQRRFKIPGGYRILTLICIVPCVVGFIAIYINGTDYFIGGVLGMLSGPVMYIIWKRKYGGLAKNDPENFIINSKTKLAVGDMYRMAATFGILAVCCVIGKPWLTWFEGDWGQDYYTEANAGIPLLHDFDMMLNAITIVGAIFALIAIMCVIAGKYTEPSKEERKEALEKACKATYKKV